MTAQPPGGKRRGTPWGRYALATVLLTATYALVLGSFAPPDLLLGAALSAALLFFCRDFVFGGRETGGLAGRILAFVPFVAVALWDILRGTWTVSLVTLHVRELTTSGVVAVPVGERTDAGIAVSALVSTLSPGTFLVDVDRERGVMLIHTIDASDPESVRQDHQRFYERYQRKVFP